MSIQDATQTWRRRKAAQDAADAYRELGDDGRMINTRFRVWESFDPIPLGVIMSALEQEPALAIAVRRILNYFEGLANGVFYGLYDELVIKDSFCAAMAATYRRFQEFVEYRRAHGSPRAWHQLQIINQRWQA